MRYLRAMALGFGLAAVTTACDITDLDINQDPNAATEVDADFLFPTVQAQLASTRMIEINPGNALHAQIFASNGSAGVFLEPERYDISDFTTGNAWSALFGTSLRNLSLMENQALEGGRNNVAAQAGIMKAYIFFLLTSLWEEIPYAQALDGAQFAEPEFDDQETVLRGILVDLDEAMALIDDSGPVTAGDLIYGGNMDHWRRFGNSLKLRTLMHIRNRDTGVDAQIEALLSEPLIRENAHEAAIPFFTTTGNENNVWKLNNMFAGFVNAGEGNQFIYAGEPLVNLMKDLGDPRLDTYWEYARVDFGVAPDGGGAATDEHFGQRAGVSNFNDARTSMLHQNIVRRDWPNRILPAAEVWLYEAEFHATRGNLGAAHSSYQQGVRRALSFFDGQPGAIPAAQQDAYLASLPASFAGQGAAMNAIHAQQYIEVFDRSPENWNHWRRTGFPTLSLPEQATLGDIIRRYPYPPSEQAANPNTPPNPPLDQPMWFEGN